MNDHFVAPQYVPELQACATLNQAAPVQNTWYPILATTRNVRVYGVVVKVADTGEDLQIKLTVDGVELASSANLVAAANTGYYVYLLPYVTGCFIQHDDNASGKARAFLMEGRSVKVEVRKVTANGAGNLQGCVVYGKW